MKCKDCAVGKRVKCPHCGDIIIWCGEDHHLVEWYYWDNEDEIRCDGVVG